MFRGPGSECQGGGTYAFFDDALVWGWRTWRWDGQQGPAAAVADPEVETGGWWIERSGARFGAWTGDKAIHLCTPDCRALLHEEPSSTIMSCSPDGRCNMVPTQPSQEVIALSADGRRVAIGGEALSIRDTIEGTELLRVSGEARDMVATFSADGEVFAWKARDEVRVWDGTTIRTLPAATAHRILIDRSGRRVVLDAFHTSPIYDMGTDAPVAVVKGGARALSPDGSTLLVQSHDRLLLYPLP